MLNQGTFRTWCIPDILDCNLHNAKPGMVIELGGVCNQDWIGCILEVSLLRSQNEIHVTNVEDNCSAIVNQYWHWYMLNEQGNPVLGSYVNSCTLYKSHY